MRVLVEADRGRQRGIDRIVAARRAHLVGMAGEPVGKVDAQPFAAEPAVGERGAARIGVARRASPRRRRAARGIGWPVRTASKRRAPVLRGGLEQRRHEHVERPEADPQPVQRVAVGLLEMRDRR